MNRLINLLVVSDGDHSHLFYRLYHLWHLFHLYHLYGNRGRGHRGDSRHDEEASGAFPTC